MIFLAPSGAQGIFNPTSGSTLILHHLSELDLQSDLSAELGLAKLYLISLSAGQTEPKILRLVPVKSLLAIS